MIDQTVRDHSHKMKLRDHLRSYKELIAKLKRKVDELAYGKAIAEAETAICEARCKKLEKQTKNGGMPMRLVKIEWKDAVRLEEEMTTEQLCRFAPQASPAPQIRRVLPALRQERTARNNDWQPRLV